MSTVTMRDLRNHGADAIAKAGHGETRTVTRDGKPVAELRPLDREPLRAGRIPVTTSVAPGASRVRAPMMR